MIKIIWSEKKNRLNIYKHRIDFEEAKTIFYDPLQLSEATLIILSMSKDSLLSECPRKIGY